MVVIEHYCCCNMLEVQREVRNFAVVAAVDNSVDIAWNYVSSYDHMSRETITYGCGEYCC